MVTTSPEAKRRIAIKNVSQAFAIPRHEAERLVDEGHVDVEDYTE